MSRVLKGLQEKGLELPDAILAGLGPYRRAHINRFGEYPLDLDRPVPPMDYKINFTK